VSDLVAEPPDLFPKHCQVIHRYRIAHLWTYAVLLRGIHISPCETCRKTFIKHGLEGWFCVESFLGLS
jgi:hypothetical protein